MGLDRKKLQKAVDLANGLVRARCPACAESGGDSKGEHLRVYPDGRFGCCVCPGDREHRRRIFALAGEHVRPGIKVRTAAVKVGGTVRAGILGRLGRLFPNPAGDQGLRDGRDGGSEVPAKDQERDLSGTPGTGSVKSKPETGEQAVLALDGKEVPGTAGTGFQNSRVYVKKTPSEEGNNMYALKEFGEGVPSVPERKTEEPAVGRPETAAKAERLPYFTPGGTLVIPFDSPERYHWWKNGQSVTETIAELRSGKEM